MANARDEEIETLKARIAELEGNENRRLALKEIEDIKLEINKLTYRLMALADEHELRVDLSAPFNQARGAGGMEYYGVGHPGRLDEDGSYVVPDSYGGWRSSATDYC